MREKPELNYFYCELYDRMHNSCKSEDKEILQSDAENIIGVAHNIPRCLRPCMIKEMEQVGWIERVNKMYIKLVHPLFNLKESPSIMNEQLGMF